MAYCPQCGVEYREDAFECIDCHVPLRPGAPAESIATKQQSAPPLVRIRVFTGPTAAMQADLARNLLETEGIPCVLPGQVMGEILPGIEPIAMLVRASDAERASEILEAFLENPLIEPAD